VSLWQQAADCYREARALGDAARCYERAGFLQRAADLRLELGEPAAAAVLFERSGDAPRAAWVLLDAGDPQAARACLARNPAPAAAPDGDDRGTVPRLLHGLACARCDVADGLRTTSTLDAIADVQDALAGPSLANDPRLREWAVDLAVLVERLDQVALIFAAAVRGRRPRAAALWATWVGDRYGTPLVLPGEPALAGQHADV
jgi:hypothetical protein